MPKCERCQKELSTEEGLAQHMRDKHGIGKVSKHEAKEQKKQEKEKQKEQEVSKAKSGKRARNIAIVAVFILLIAGIGYVISTLPKAQPPPAANTYNLTGFPSNFVHWHADVDVIICGEEKQLPYSPVGGLLGTGRLHTHDYAQNIASLPDSDGNGIVHTEGNIRTVPQEHTLDKFMGNIGVRFSETEIMDKKNGDLCSGTPGSVKVFLNNQTLENPLNYLPRDQDYILIEFS